MDNTMDNYAHRLSVKNDICYESAFDMLKQSIYKLSDHKYTSDNLIRSAYKYARYKLNKTGGGNNLVPLKLSKKFH